MAIKSQSDIVVAAVHDLDYSFGVTALKKSAKAIGANWTTLSMKWYMRRAAGGCSDMGC